MRALSSLPASIGASVWSADALSSVADRVVATGHAALDAELPGGGWPLGALVELLQPAPIAAVWPLLWPALAERVRAPVGQTGRNLAAAKAARVVLINPPHEPYAPALTAAGVPAARLLWLAADAPAAQLWAAEQALRCQDVAAVVAWLPRAQMGELRRLQQAAAQTGALLFVLRPERAAQAASPARVRLRVAGEVRVPRQPRLQLVGEGGQAQPLPPGAAHGLPMLRVDLLKRRGPPLEEPLWLPVCSDPVWAVALAALAGDGVATAPIPVIEQAPLQAGQAAAAVAALRHLQQVSGDWQQAVAPLSPQIAVQTDGPIRPVHALPGWALCPQAGSPTPSSLRIRAQPLLSTPTVEVRHALAGIAVGA
ncbi:translesion DNA synthesis-associated protein ImuA [Ottowia testudinis]|uniref:Translesion DNA synthesis-associated protein ImuA n=1 Tax=Ottowia testudinis TaxID=2816950 RepID=A0A975CIE9_9BURK|nr:translesion DNA synthesis-associated protein ImuA [Ottowia testudinis]QTD46925.1 translesion DNA synthesis-associated protein ImuA [Ottowia testudinis]